MASGETAIAASSHDSATPQPQSQDQEDGPACLQREKREGQVLRGHLKRWFYAVDVLEQECGCVEKAWGADAEVYRCEFCQTLYLPSPDDPRG